MRLTSLTCTALAFVTNVVAQSSADDNTTQPVSFFYTRPLSQAPALNVTIQADFTPGYIFMSPYKSTKPAPYIYDKFGNLVWDGYGVTGSANAHNFRPCQYNDAPHLCFNQVNQQNGYGIGQSIVVDQNYKVVATAQTGGNVEPVDMHEFQLLNNGETAIVSSYQIVPYDLSYFNITTGLGWLSEGVFQEVNVTTGEVLFEWFSTNHVDPSASQITPNSTDTGGDGFGPQTAFDYFHINSIDKSTVTGNYLVSARHTSTLYYVNATSRDIIWQLSYLGQTDYSLSGWNFSFSHDARLLSENDTTTVLSIFDNASNGYTTTTSQSSGKVIAIDHNSGVATMLSNTTYPSDQGLLATSQGNTQLLSNGGFFHTWGNNPYLSEHSANGTAVFAAQFAAEGSAQNYRAFSADWESTPATTIPDVYAYAVNSSAPTRIYVSWNGCTTVTSWQFYGGDSVGEDFAAIGNTTKQGFETFWEADKFYQWNDMPLVYLHDWCYLASPSYYLGEPGGPVTFAALVQWAELFYCGALSEEAFANVETGLGAAPANPSHFQIVWDDEPGLEPVSPREQTTVTKVMYELRKEAVRLAKDPGNVSMRYAVFHWLVNDVEPFPRENRMKEMRESVCMMIGRNFNKQTGYHKATRLYM
ncbi:hypothetical protein KCU78_g5845, partial [Aureobasidium melanogenum]